MSNLTQLQVNKAEIKEKEYLLNDGNGLFVRILPSGKKIFLLKIAKNSQSLKCSLGDATILTLKEARQIAEKKRMDFKPLSKEAISLKIKFCDIYDNYMSIKTKKISAKYAKRAKSYNERFYKNFANKKVSEISRRDVINALKPLIDENKKESFLKAIGILSGIFKYAVQMEYCQSNIIRDIDASQFFGKIETKHRAYFSEIEQALELKNRILNYYGAPSLKACAIFQLYTATRPSEARLATWQEFDFEKCIWKIPKERMKAGKAHDITLSSQLLGLIKELAKKEHKQTDYVFLSLKAGRAWSDNAVNTMLKNLGYTSDIITPHGFRGTFATIANELCDEHGFSNDIVQLCLAHEIQNEVAKAYNHATFEKQRATLMQWWSDKLGSIMIA